VLLSLFVYQTAKAALQEEIETIAANQDSGRESMVIFLHGALKTAWSMKRLETAFADSGYLTYNWDYNSRDFNVIQNAAKLDSIIRDNGYDRYQLNFVTHSMGGIVARYYLSNYHPPHVGRFVMIAPPNQGSKIATELQDFAPFRWLYKKNVDYLLTGKNAFAPNAGIPNCPFGIIAGGTGGKYGYTWYLPGDDDTILSVTQTKLPGAKDFILLHHIHATIMLQDDTIRETLYFIRHGQFNHHITNTEIE